VLGRDQEVAHLDLTRTVFLDTETTGLGTGAGTRVFLVGAGYLDGEGFTVRQFFLRSLGEESVFLAELAAFLGRFNAVVTFNGKAFDWPLLESRFVLLRGSRHTLPPDPLHLDLLHPARRLWKTRLESCALTSLEAWILGVRRSEEDVPGYLIPSLYFAYLRTGDALQLRRVFYHNLHDILSLAALTVHIDRVLTDPFCGLVEQGTDFYCLGKAYERAGHGDSAAQCYQEALQRELTRDLRTDCLARLAGLHKRERRWEEALQSWDRLIDEGGEGCLAGLVERAKYYEHVERDVMQALEDVQQALNLLDLLDGPADEPLRRDLERRLSRLLTRAYRQRVWARSDA
jgi:tetratricopeptide (TPR) repeat protein